MSNESPAASERTTPAQRRNNIRMGLLLGAFVIMVIIGSIVNFYYAGLPQDPNRMRERENHVEAAREQGLSEALQKADKIQDTQPKTTSEEVK